MTFLCSIFIDFFLFVDVHFGVELIMFEGHYFKIWFRII